MRHTCGLTKGVLIHLGEGAGKGIQQLGEEALVARAGSGLRGDSSTRVARGQRRLRRSQGGAGGGLCAAHEAGDGALSAWEWVGGGGAEDAAAEAALTSSTAVAAEASRALPDCWLFCTAATLTQRAREHGVWRKAETRGAVVARAMVVCLLWCSAAVLRRVKEQWGHCSRCTHLFLGNCGVQGYASP